MHICGIIVKYCRVYQFNTSCTIIHSYSHLNFVPWRLLSLLIQILLPFQPFSENKNKKNIFTILLYVVEHYLGNKIIHSVNCRVFNYSHDNPKDGCSHVGDVSTAPLPPPPQLSLNGNFEIIQLKNTETITSFGAQI